MFRLLELSTPVPASEKTKGAAKVPPRSSRDKAGHSHHTAAKLGSGMSTRPPYDYEAGHDANRRGHPAVNFAVGLGWAGR